MNQSALTFAQFADQSETMDLSRAIDEQTRKALLVTLRDKANQIVFLEVFFVGIEAIYIYAFLWQNLFPETIAGIERYIHVGNLAWVFMATCFGRAYAIRQSVVARIVAACLASVLFGTMGTIMWPITQTAGLLYFWYAIFNVVAASRLFALLLKGLR